jgi:uncharacterized protein YutE (UPF0331/DUF86 family)
MGSVAIGETWGELLKQRALLYANRVGFADVEDYIAQKHSGKLEEQNRVMAIEAQTNLAWTLMTDLIRAVLVAQDEADATSIRGMTVGEWLEVARTRRVITREQWEALDTLQGGRNELVHAYQHVRDRAAWKQIELMGGEIDSLMWRLQTKLEDIGERVEMDFPNFEGGVDLG